MLFALNYNPKLLAPLVNVFVVNQHWGGKKKNLLQSSWYHGTPAFSTLCNIPLTKITARNRRPFLNTKALHIHQGPLLSPSAHKFAVMFRSGDLNWNIKGLILLSLNRFCLDCLNTRFGQWSGWKIQPCPRCSFLV